ncbi:hypothetical protein [Magnetovibrio sp.]|uniref:hypothetical protein n=1 Tax=Magnetovibrio sp. TaxID=2024836 RepID=UPI002F949297
MDKYSDQYLEEYNTKFSQHVISAAYFYKDDQPEGINIHLTAGVVDPHLIKTTVKVAEVTGHVGYRKVTEGELSIEHLVDMTEELIKDVKNQPTSLLSAEKLKEHTVFTGIIAGNIIALLLLGHIQNDEHNGYSYEVNSKDAKPLR